jgi:hypothetical protein
VEVQDLGQLLRKAHRLEQVLQADGAPRHLVLVGRPDAAPRGADLLRALRRFAREVERRVVRQDERAGFRDPQARRHRHAGRLQLVHFLHQRLRREHHAVADVAVHAGAQDPRGDEVQHRLLAGDDQRVAGVVPALEAHHALRAVGEPVDDLALALVAPLGADHYDVARAHGLARLRRSIENPVAGRARPKALPTSS